MANNINTSELIEPPSLGELLTADIALGMGKWDTHIASDFFYSLLRKHVQKHEALEALNDCIEALNAWWCNSEIHQESCRCVFCYTCNQHSPNNLARFKRQWRHARLLLEFGNQLHLVNPADLEDFRRTNWNAINERILALTPLGFSLSDNISSPGANERLVWLNILAGLPLNPKVQVVFATAPKHDPGTEPGMIHILQVEVFSNGYGYVGSHPRDFYTRDLIWTDICDTLEKAWEVAVKHAKAEQPEANFEQFGVCWRILDEEGQPVTTEIQGNSLGGAAVRAFHYALTGRVPDKEVLVMMALDEKGQFEPVAGVPAKTRAALASQKLSIDTIVVLKEKAAEGKTSNQQEAETVITAHNAHERMRVVALG